MAATTWLIFDCWLDNHLRRRLSLGCVHGKKGGHTQLNGTSPARGHHCVLPLNRGEEGGSVVKKIKLSSTCTHGYQKSRVNTCQLPHSNTGDDSDCSDESDYVDQGEEPASEGIS